MFKDLLFAITGARTDRQTLAFAVELATLFDAHLAVSQTVTFPAPMPYPWGFSPDVSQPALYATLREQGNRAADEWRNSLEASTVSHEVRLTESYLDAGAVHALQARYADLALVSNAAAEDLAHPMQRLVFHSLLMDSGRPVMVVPAAPPATFRPRRVMVAWSPGRASTRAVHDAMPFLERADAVDVVMVEPRTDAAKHGELPGADIGTHLSRHGLKVQVMDMSSDGQRVAAVLLRTAQESGADLIVAGGFGHSRAREWILGGTTRELLEESTLPILFSH